MKRSSQLSFDDPRLKKVSAFGGELMKKVKGRSTPRPISTKYPMHIVLKSSRARGDFSFLKPQNRKVINQTLSELSQKFHVKILGLANVGNHLHLMLKFKKRGLYLDFIRSFTGSLALRIGKKTRWNRANQESPLNPNLLKFWDYRHFSRIIAGFKNFVRAKEYLWINQLEGRGVPRDLAEWSIKAKTHRSTPRTRPMQIPSKQNANAYFSILT